jgi:hypothetical protein
MVSMEVLELTVRNTLNESQDLSEVDFEIRFQRKCAWLDVWVVIV